MRGKILQLKMSLKLRQRLLVIQEKLLKILQKKNPKKLLRVKIQLLKIKQRL